KGAICVLRREVRDTTDGTLYCEIDQTVALRGEGGFGGEPLPRTARPEPPARAPDRVERVTTSSRAALIYRLSGDLNPLHADYAVARRAGYDRPILHGLASYGAVCAVLLRAFCDSDPARLKSLGLRFAGVVMPGDRLDIACWRDADRILFEARVDGRVVLDQGVAQVA
ncbi:MAG: MaoC family dehydratase, partial [Methylobacteriaceae bacterium]|nr:MaoC family dehydratase [Methylobacteriaceae bacterium]